MNIIHSFILCVVMLVESVLLQKLISEKGSRLLISWALRLKNLMLTAVTFFDNSRTVSHANIVIRLVCRRHVNQKIFAYSVFIASVGRLRRCCVRSCHEAFLNSIHRHQTGGRVIDWIHFLHYLVIYLGRPSITSWWVFAFDATAIIIINVVVVAVVAVVSSSSSSSST